MPKHRGMKTKSYYPRRVYTVDKGRGQMMKLRTPRVKLFTWKAPDPTQYLRSFIPLLKIPSFRVTKNEFKPPIRRIKPFKAAPSMTRGGTGNAGGKRTGKRKPYSSTIKPTLSPAQKIHKEAARRRKAGWWKEDNWKNFVATTNRRFRTGWKIDEAEARIPRILQGFRFPMGRDGWGGTRERTQGWHITGFGGHRYWGPAGPHKPALVFDLRLNRKELQVMIDGYKEHFGVIMTKGKILRDIERAMWILKEDILKASANYINRYVPKDTGTLRRTMIASLTKAPVVNCTIRMVLDSGELKYAKPVNNMPTSILQHDMTKKRRHSSGWYNTKGELVKNRVHQGFNWEGEARDKQIHAKKRAQIPDTDKYLHDPHAVKSHWGFAVMDIRAQAKAAYQNFIANMVVILTQTVYKNTGNPIPKQVKVRYIDMMKKIEFKHRVANMRLDPRILTKNGIKYLEANMNTEAFQKKTKKIQLQMLDMLKDSKINMDSPNWRVEIRKWMVRTFAREYKRRPKKGSKNEMAKVNVDYMPELMHTFPNIWRALMVDIDIPPKNL